MMEKWIETRKGGDFATIAEKFKIDPVIARIIRNRDIVGDEAIYAFLHEDQAQLYSPHLMKDMDRAVAILFQKIKQKKSIRIIGDYDIDGVNATYILLKGIQRCGGNVDAAIPDRMKDGYGINETLIEEALEKQIDTIVTCDNGIAAIDAINYAKEQGITVVVTDHHDIPFVMKGDIRISQKSTADAIVNPKQEECTYPFKELCGAAVAWKLVQTLYEAFQIPIEEAELFLENVGFATVGDVMDLKDENRVLVKLGLNSIHHTQNPGMRALILQNKLELEQIKSYHIGFVIGPCINASGRLDTAKRSLSLLMEEKDEVAAAIAQELIDLNDSRKSMTIQQLELAKELITEQKIDQDKVMVVYLPECHESLAGIIAGRIRELYHKPVFVLTKSEDGVKGSGRSIEEYSMYEEMNKIADIFRKFGGHPMAAGLLLAEDRVEEFRRRMNEECILTDEELVSKIHIDVSMPIGYINAVLVSQLDILEPFGKGNAKPVFADRGVGIKSARIVGKNANVLQLQMYSATCNQMKAVYFGDIEKFLAYLTQKYGVEEVDHMMRGKRNHIQLSIIYDPAIDHYNGREKPQLILRKFV